MPVSKVAILGAGTMGASIATATGKAGYETILADVDSEALAKGMERIKKFVESLKKKGLSDSEASKILESIKPGEMNDFAGCDLVIEAVVEKIQVKKDVFHRLESICTRDTIFASNTSSLSITEVASALEHPERFLGLHFFNPAHLMKLVEVIPALQTSQQVTDAGLEFARSLEKLAVRVNECPSFLVNRLLGRYMNEALFCLYEGRATVEEIDRAACDLVMPVGPCALRDMNGADIGLAVADYNFKEYGERFRPSPVLEAMVERQWLGQKTLKGFYIYDPETRKRQGTNPDLKELLPPESAGGFDPMQLFLPMINETFLVLQENVAGVEDIDPALMAGLGMRKGPLALALQFGPERCLSMLEELFQEKGERFRPAPLLKRYVRAGLFPVKAPLVTA